MKLWKIIGNTSIAHGLNIFLCIYVYVYVGAYIIYIFRCLMIIMIYEFAYEDVMGVKAGADIPFTLP